MLCIIFLQKEYKSFDEYVEVELAKFKKFLANQGLEKLKNEDNKFYDSILYGHWGRFFKGIYYFHLQHWYNVFNRSDILILDGDLLTLEPWQVLEEVQQFLDIPIVIRKENFVMNEATGFYCLLLSGKSKDCGAKRRTRLKSSNGTLSSKMPEKSLKILNEFYKQYESELSNVTNKKFNWMN